MDHAYDIPDSTDWLGTPLSQLARVESALRCQVCKDFFDNPVITSCSHTFCSLCIRRCLSTEGKCPACRTADQELKLRRDWAMQELVDSFKQARPSVLEFARSATVRTNGLEEDVEMPVAKKRKVDVTASVSENGEVGMGAEGMRTRSQRRRSDDQALQMKVEVIEDTEDEDFEPDDGLVACPVCHRRMKNEAVFAHLDSCTGSPDTPKPPISFRPLRLRSPDRPLKQSPPTHVPKRLPTLNYSLLKDTVLRRKLKELGIPDWGPKPLLQKRHTEWMNIWNANCDSKVPKSKRELLRELDIWERTQGGQAPTASSLSTAYSVMRKDFDASAWSTTHGDDYKTLIASARTKKEQIAQVSHSETTLTNDQGARDHGDDEPERIVTKTSLPDTQNSIQGGEGELNSNIIGASVNEISAGGNSAGIKPHK
ncbi:DNA repair protein rad18 [Emergomyces africanus]|uniref:Postreplication repair E3 ubiquitin-protein ligase RAD18 n=1 Tax=Emergomyces africanus TaxID=1955775 RepID=A0A1B7P7Z4_9EURO|nr:DNA repair protein rad18 [Emergomyces africanus]